MNDAIPAPALLVQVSIPAHTPAQAERIRAQVEKMFAESAAYVVANPAAAIAPPATRTEEHAAAIAAAPAPIFDPAPPAPVVAPFVVSYGDPLRDKYTGAIVRVVAVRDLFFDWENVDANANPNTLRGACPLEFGADCFEPVSADTLPADLAPLPALPEPPAAVEAPPPPAPAVQLHQGDRLRDLHTGAIVRVLYAGEFAFTWENEDPAAAPNAAKGACDLDLFANCFEFIPAAAEPETPTDASAASDEPAAADVPEKKKRRHR